MLSVSPAISDALKADQLRFAWLLDLPLGTCLTNHASDLDIGGTTYYSRGFVLGLSNITREQGIKLQDYTIRLSGVDEYDANSDGQTDSSSLSFLFSQVNLTGTACQVKLVLFDAAGVVIDQPISLYKGTFHTMIERESDSSIRLEIQLASPWSKPSLTAGRITSNNNQTDLYPGDKFFEFSHEEKKDLGWGRD